MEVTKLLAPSMLAMNAVKSVLVETLAKSILAKNILVLREISLMPTSGCVYLSVHPQQRHLPFFSTPP